MSIRSVRVILKVVLLQCFQLSLLPSPPRGFVQDPPLTRGGLTCAPSTWWTIHDREDHLLEKSLPWSLIFFPDIAHLARMRFVWLSARASASGSLVVDVGSKVIHSCVGHSPESAKSRKEVCEPKFGEFEYHHGMRRWIDTSARWDGQIEEEGRKGAEF